MKGLNQTIINENKLDRLFKTPFDLDVEQVQATDLCVVTPICDQICANEGAINILKKETQSYYAKHQKGYRDDIYEIEVKSDYIYLSIDIIKS